MRQFSRPKVVVSKCIEFASCRWNGLKISSDVVKSLTPSVDFHPVCPEYEIGLGIPRDPIRVVSSGDGLRLLQPATGRDVTGEMNAFARAFLDSVGEVDGFILKGRSPSCGIKDVNIYPGVGKQAAVARGAGFFGQAVLDAFPALSIEDEGRLTNFRLREHFLTKLFTLASFRRVKEERRMARLVSFHTRNKLMLMAYNQKELRSLGRIVANPEHRPIDELLARYEDRLHAALLRPARYTSNINVCMHALGYFSEELASKEKAYFLDSLERYREGKIPLSVCLSLIMSWIVRFDEPYLLDQTFFQPYPGELVEISDSGKGRNLSS
ncbi:MAG TPA: DUF523 and DUF1722 domain-containing protein [Patescibacteria group bacterium]|nr:DUF523 and DUF1722 domain-containing protein [Patescibacteria group bacterium]